MVRYLFILLVITSCSHHEELKNQHLVGGSCEQEFNKAELGPGEKIWQDVSHTSATGASYLVTGIGHSTDFIVSFTGGIISGVVVCSPVLALTALSYSSGTTTSSGGDCVAQIGSMAYKKVNPNLGEMAYEKAHNWRCPNLDVVLDGLLRVSTCYEKAGDHEKSRAQLERLATSKVFRRCLPAKDMKKIEQKLSDLSINR